MVTLVNLLFRQIKHTHYNMKTIIAGSRENVRYEDICDAVIASGWTDLITEVVSGTASGADTYGETWAKLFEKPVQRFIPDWKNLGKKAGFVRNQEMAEYADALIAIWDGKSAGTKHMIDSAHALNLQVYVYHVEPEQLMTDLLDDVIDAGIQRVSDHSRMQFDKLPEQIKKKAFCARERLIQRWNPTK